jgi:hypothetical protein
MIVNSKDVSQVKAEGGTSLVSKADQILCFQFGRTVTQFIYRVIVH